jgi:hypothetical protein
MIAKHLACADQDTAGMAVGSVGAATLIEQKISGGLRLLRTAAFAELNDRC